MSHSTRIVVIGGVAAGPKAAARARRRDAQAHITLIERGQLLSYAGCGMPYYIEGLVKDTRELMCTPVGVVRDAVFFKNVKDIDVRTSTLAEGIDREKKEVRLVRVDTGEQEALAYDQLVLATGGLPIVPPIEGIDLNRVFRLNHPDDAVAIHDAVASGAIQRAVLVGGGLIGMETAEALAARGVEVVVVEMMEHLLPMLLDLEPAIFLTKHLQAKGVEVRTGEKVVQLVGDDQGNVRQVLTDHSALDADLVLLAIGVRPNTHLARGAGLEIGETGAIAVNDRLQTSDPHIFAGGDCVECLHRVTGEKVYVPLGSTANKQGRIIGDNVTGGDSRFPGIVGTTVFKAFDFNVARTGLTEKQAQQKGYSCLTTLSPAPDRAHYYPGNQPILVKLVVERENGRLLGAQVVGPGEAVKRTDVLATALTLGATVDDLADLDLGYAPPYSGALDNIHHAVNIVRNKRDGLAKALSPQEVKAKLERGDDFILLDVRTPAELEETRWEDERVQWIPLGQLRQRWEELPRDREIVCFCKISLRGYEAQTILEGAGFPQVKFLDGGLVAWPYSLHPIQAPGSTVE